ncbi:sigma factor-like helix-turn-helix DNA-binding protein [Bacillus sp. JJ1562]
MSIYKTIRNVLPERMQIVLNEIYGVDKEECSKLKPVGVILNISPERVRQIIYRAESILAKELSLAFGNNKKNKAWR